MFLVSEVPLYQKGRFSHAESLNLETGKKILAASWEFEPYVETGASLLEGRLRFSKVR